MPRPHRVTVLDLRLGLFSLSEQDRETINRCVAPILAAATLRQLDTESEDAAPQRKARRRSRGIPPPRP